MKLRKMKERIETPVMTQAIQYVTSSPLEISSIFQFQVSNVVPEKSYNIELRVSLTEKTMKRGLRSVARGRVYRVAVVVKVVGLVQFVMYKH